MLEWLRKVALKLLRNAVDTFVQESLDKAIEELNEAVDAQYSDEEARVIKSGFELLKSRVGVIVREKLEK